MKKMNLMCMIVLSLGFANGASAETGNEGVGGGDSIVAQFYDVAKQVRIAIANKNSKEISLDQFDAQLGSAVIESTNKRLFVNKIEKDAVNYPGKGKILLNRKRWLAIGFNQRSILVLHEVLGLLKIDDTKYQVSNKVVGDLRYCLAKENRADFEKRAKEVATNHCRGNQHQNLQMSGSLLKVSPTTNETHLVSWNCGEHQYLAALQTNPIDNCKEISYQFIRAKEVK